MKMKMQILRNKRSNFAKSDDSLRWRNAMQVGSKTTCLCQKITIGKMCFCQTKTSLSDKLLAPFGGVNYSKVVLRM